MAFHEPIHQTEHLVTASVKVIHQGERPLQLTSWHRGWRVSEPTQRREGIGQDRQGPLRSIQSTNC